MLYDGGEGVEILVLSWWVCWYVAGHAGGEWDGHVGVDVCYMLVGEG